MIPRATYRVQLHSGFTFDDAAATIPYLASLGISHLYTSPVLQARPGSTHGYDVTDHSRVSAELGGEAGFERLTDALRANGMGLVLDIVPNHMAIGQENRWWWDVLEHGPASRYAAYFDVDWDPPESRLRDVILLPVLPDHYGRVLEAGGIRLARRGGRLVVEHGALVFPVDPRTACGPVSDAAGRAGSPELASIATALGELPRSTSSDPALVARRQRDAESIATRLDELVTQPALAGALDAAVDAITVDVDALDALLEDQNYRLARWRSASRDLGYRRFFDVDDLIGLRVEDDRVFAETHELVLRWVDEGRVDGLRVDHPDGLSDPAGYLARLRAAAPDAWIVVEKILASGEELPGDWPVDGTTGYRFANLATGVLVDRRAEPPMSELWATLADAGPDWEAVAADARAEVLSTVLGSDVNRLTKLFLAACEANRRYRDFTRHDLHQALREVAAALPVYRTYARAHDRHLGDADRRLINGAVALAEERRPDLDRELFGFLGSILRLEVAGPQAAELAMRFQQLTPAAMAKGVEDTAFYRHHRLVALNEVGGDPGRFGTSAEAFHAAMSEAAERWPHGMLTLSTHDTKRSADVRARLAAVPADPGAWRRSVARLLDASRPHRSGDGMPTDADAYLLLQVVVGAWPIDADRAAAYLAKAAREAKLRTSWTDPDPSYDHAVQAFVRGALGDPAFVALVQEVVADVLEAGRIGSLAQLALQLMAPGVPDLYQGNELLDLSLVDPDNRRPIDYVARERLAEEAAALDAVAARARPDDGLPKLWLVRRLLDLRARRPDAVGGDYGPLAVEGAEDEVIAFVRGASVAVVVPVRATLPRGCAVDLPDGTWLGLDGAERAGRIDVAELVVDFPVAVLERVP